MGRLIRGVIAVAVVLAGVAACGEPECPSYLRTEGDDCVVPGPADAGTRTPSESQESPQSTFDASIGSETGTGGRAPAGSMQADRETRRDASSAGGSAGDPPANAAGAGGMSTTDRADAGLADVGSVDAGARSSITCGDGKREGDELCDGDCPVECKSDNACIVAKMEGSPATCDARCMTVETTMCGEADGCCPMGCNHGTDMDCSPSCGDGVLSGSETCEPGSSEHPCPTREQCDDGDACTIDMLVGDAERCTAECVTVPSTCNPEDLPARTGTIVALYEVCLSTSECPTGECINGICTQRCSGSGAPCPAAPNGLTSGCYAYDQVYRCEVNDCSSNADCPTGPQMCLEASETKPSACRPGSCRNNSHCTWASGAICANYELPDKATLGEPIPGMCAEGPL